MRFLPLVKVRGKWLSLQVLPQKAFSERQCLKVHVALPCRQVKRSPCLEVKHLVDATALLRSTFVLL